MLTQDSQYEHQNKRSITIPFSFAVAVVLLICAMLTAGALVMSTTNDLTKSPRLVITDWAKNSGWTADRGVRIRTGVLSAPTRYLKSLSSDPELPKLVIDIKFKHFEQLRARRDRALVAGMMLQEEDELVPADIRIEDRQVKVKLRLKGDLPDHYDSDKWSMRIEVSGDEQILGMRRFSLQHPKVRSFQAEPVFMETLRHNGVLGVRYLFVHVIVNGEDKGIMALEEHFSKELLEHSARREGVFLRFDETSFWDYQKFGGDYRNSPYDNFRNSRVITFGEKKIQQSPALLAQYRTGVGLLRNFASGRISASEAFDVETTANYLAVMELWGSWHSIQWNDMKFYFDPLTMKLEPVGYDANLMLRTDPRALTLTREPIFAALLSDPQISEEYLKKLREICLDVADGELGEKIVRMERDLVSVLRDEYLLLEPMDLDLMIERARFLLELDDADLLQAADDYPRRIRYPALVQANLVSNEDGDYLELASYLAEPVTITSIQWRDLESGERTPARFEENRELPLQLANTVVGEVPEFVALRLTDSLDPATRELIITTQYASWPVDKEIIPQSYFPPLRKHPVPTATADQQILAHSFISRDSDSNVLIVAPGRWSVESDIIVPPGFSLSVGAGTTLEFASGAALISSGALNISGTGDDPVVLRGIGTSPWQGVAVMRADSQSILRHVDIQNTTGVSRDSWVMAGGVNFYHSDVGMEDVSIRKHQGADALNIVRSQFDIVRLTIADAQYDALDADFSKGTIRASVFTDIGPNAGGGDAIDISGSEVVVDDIRFTRIGDKALSVGEGSHMQASNVVIDGAGTAAASKDGSHLDLNGMVVNEVMFAGLMAYTKKREYGAATIKAANVTYKPAGPVARVQIGSQIELDGTFVPAEDIDVELLYETVMRKGP